MSRAFGKVSILLLLGIFLSSCGDVEKIDQAQPEELAAINAVLKRWREGYENEDVDTYMSSFWPEGFRYESDLGTGEDTTDDVVFDTIRDERESAIRVFSRFQDIEIEISEPPEITLNQERTTAEVRNHYRIQGFVADGETLGDGYTGWFAEGDNLFIFEFRNDEWRITEWFDEAFSEEEIIAANNL
ncbi:hypothetical protein IH992_03570 [Candidatus Poribacteria bacterium]|nr:hypothetical protein [Candidatus Poribacteria bacterium]